MSRPTTILTEFDAWASGYELSALQPTLFVPAQQMALDLARQHMPWPRRILDVGCGTARLLRQARQLYPHTHMVGVDVAWQMLWSAAAATPTALTIRYVRTVAERLPFASHRFELVFATMSLRHWANPTAGIAEIERVLIPGGVLVVADVFPTLPPARRTVRLLPRRHRSHLPPQLAAALTARRLAVVGHRDIPWFRLPDIQVIAARQQPCTPTSQYGRDPSSRLHSRPRSLGQ